MADKGLLAKRVIAETKDFKEKKGHLDRKESR
jgi:hypothetical protein